MQVTLVSLCGSLRLYTNRFLLFYQILSTVLLKKPQITCIRVLHISGAGCIRVLHVLHMATGCLPPTPMDNLFILAGIQPTELSLQNPVASLACAQEPEHPVSTWWTIATT